ncbi:NepR family anti-sigma factor [Hyphomonas sp.]|uniref:NepR family anti-sigma factor n=1 Tax=Hyphomonas sp. TaxID=87 RepID=UPI0039187B19
MSEDEKNPVLGPIAGPRHRRLGNQAIGNRLREMYEGVVQEAVPDEFLRLLEQAEEKEAQAPLPNGSGEA